MATTVCPFCKKSVPQTQGACPSCGRRASDHPSVQGSQGPSLGDGWDDEDEGGGGLDLAKGSSLGTAPAKGGAGGAQASSYSGGDMSFGDDDPFAEDVPEGALELDVPTHHSANTPRSMPAQQQATPEKHQSGPQLPAARGSDPSLKPAPKSDPSLPVGPPSDAHMQRGEGPSLPADSQPSEPQVPAAPPTPRQPDPAAMIARFPIPPTKIWESPIYAMKVIWRQFELRQDLASLRKKRSPDVPLYERALKTHDTKTFVLGLAITCATLAIASFIFFLPVILRFMRDPD